MTEKEWYHLQARLSTLPVVSPLRSVGMAWSANGPCADMRVPLVGRSVA